MLENFGMVQGCMFKSGNDCPDDCLLSADALYDVGEETAGCAKCRR